jgi:hypothetical protein
MGLKEDRRFFRRPPDDYERKRQVSVIDEGTIWRLEKQFGLIAREFIKAQVVLEGDVFLPGLIGSVLAFESGAALTVAIERIPCYAMDLIAPGMRDAMRNGQQGALARVTASGVISLGDAVQVDRVEAVLSPA